MDRVWMVMQGEAAAAVDLVGGGTRLFAHRVPVDLVGGLTCPLMP